MAERRMKDERRKREATHDEDPILSLSEVARQIGKSHQTVRRWAEDGLINAIWLTEEKILGVRKSEVNKLLRGSALKALVK